MNAKLTFFALGCAAVVSTGCHHRTVHIKVQALTATAKPEVVTIRNRNFDKETKNFTVKWKAPQSAKAWLVEFDPKDTPCQQESFIIQKGGQEACVIHLGSPNVKPDESHYHKYFVFADAAHSQDPGIAHTTGRAKPRPPSVPPVTLFCLDLGKGSPASCNNGDPPTGSEPANPLKVSPLDNIYFRADSDWSVAMDTGLCNQTQISSSSQPYCTVNKAATPSTYAYKVIINGTPKGPFQIQVK